VLLVTVLSPPGVVVEPGPGLLGVGAEGSCRQFSFADDLSLLTGIAERTPHG